MLLISWMDQIFVLNGLVKNGLINSVAGKRLVGSDQLFLSEVEDLVRSNFEKQMSDIFIKKRYEKAVCFFEFWGEHSFAGKHEEEEHNLSLIDVSPHKKGILLPQDYLKLFGKLDIAPLLYQGNITHDFIK